MATTQAVTISELLQAPVITRVVNRIPTPLSFFQKFFGRLSGDNSAASENVVGRDVGWDIFDATRNFPGARAPMTPPRRVSEKPMGHVSAQLMRSHESILILAEKTFKNRALGGQITSTPVDRMGQEYVRRQIAFMTQRFRNQREWIYSRMLRGGFNILPDGDNYGLREYNAAPSDGSIPINFQIPAAHQSRCAMGSGADILTDWNQAAADILGQCFAIDRAMTRIHGRPLAHIVVNSKIATSMMKNTGLQAIRGTANRVFDTWTRKDISDDVMGGAKRNGGYSINFGAMPLWDVHVYNGVLSLDGTGDGTATSETSLLVPDDRAHFLPDADDTWEGLIDGSEVIGENLMSGGREIQGFGSWVTPCIDPYGWELKFLDNSLPVLYVPTAVAYGNVGAS